MNEGGSNSLRLGAQQRDMLRRLKEDGPFNEMLDACRLAVVLSVVSGFKEIPLDDPITIFNQGSFDASATLATAVMELCGESESEIYPRLSRMANWGVTELDRELRGDDISFRKFIGDTRD
jgi:hypothetical protein